jgi:hypothetical protein
MRYTATARRDGPWWVVQCDQLPAAISQVRRLDQAPDIHREAIAFVAGIPADQVEVDVVADVPTAVTDTLRRVATLRAEVTAAEVEARSLWTAAARELHAAGLTVRDVGTVLGVSYQRAHQLVS